MILILTSYSDDAPIYAVLRAGASGYLLKEMSGDALVQAIRRTQAALLAMRYGISWNRNDP